MQWKQLRVLDQLQRENYHGINDVSESRRYKSTYTMWARRGIRFTVSAWYHVCKAATILQWHLMMMKSELKLLYRLQKQTPGSKTVHILQVKKFQMCCVPVVVYFYLQWSGHKSWPSPINHIKATQISLPLIRPQSHADPPMSSSAIISHFREP